tara:strand:+ start:411 stop:608 length:198 start_codon:yes stop_codon:yes gene_type:complete
MENKDNFLTPDYYNTSKPKKEERMIKRKCFYCNKEKEMGVFERYCSVVCRSIATKHDNDSYRVVL